MCPYHIFKHVCVNVIWEKYFKNIISWLDTHSIRKMEQFSKAISGKSRCKGKSWLEVLYEKKKGWVGVTLLVEDSDPFLKMSDRQNS